MSKGKVTVLNGASSAGKCTLAKERTERLFHRSVAILSEEGINVIGYCAARWRNAQ